MHYLYKKLIARNLAPTLLLDHPFTYTWTPDAVINCVVFLSISTGPYSLSWRPAAADHAFYLRVCRSLQCWRICSAVRSSFPHFGELKMFSLWRCLFSLLCPVLRQDNDHLVSSVQFVVALWLYLFMLLDVRLGDRLHLEVCDTVFLFFSASILVSFFVSSDTKVWGNPSEN